MNERRDATLPTCLNKKTSELSSRSPSTATPTKKHVSIKNHFETLGYRQSHNLDIRDERDRLRGLQEFQIASFQLKS